jgi:hypothetical protein
MRTFVAILYIFLSNYVGISALTAAARDADIVAMVGHLYEKALRFFIGKQSPDALFLYWKVRCFKFGNTWTLQFRYSF